MKTPIKRFLAYDLETGGFDFERNAILEFAGVAFENDTLEIIEEFSVTFRPYLDLSGVKPDFKKEAKLLYTKLGKKNESTNKKVLEYRGNQLTLRTLAPLIEDLENFYNNYLLARTEAGEACFLTYEEYLELKKSDFGNIAEMYFNLAYSSEALEITHMSIELLLEEGLDRKEAFEKIKESVIKHTVGNSRPVIAGHNIIEFDNPFMKKLFEDNGYNFLKFVNNFVVDTLQWSRVRWLELPAFNLGSCANEIGLTLKEAHRALPDTIANAKFLIKMLKSLRGEGDQKSKYKRRKYKMNY